MQNFYIERIELHNYRKFENVEFKLDRNMNLLIGEMLPERQRFWKPSRLLWGHTLRHTGHMFQAVLSGIYRIATCGEKGSGIWNRMSW